MEELVFQYPLMRLGQFELPEPIADYKVTKKEMDILRKLADKKAQIASLEIHKEKEGMLIEKTPYLSNF
jgi:hypothetical protein